MKYKIVERTIYGNFPLVEDDVFTLGGKIKEFNSKAEASAFMIKFLPWDINDYLIKEVER